MLSAMISFAWPVLKPILAICALMLFIGLVIGLLIAG